MKKSWIPMICLILLAMLPMGVYAKGVTASPTSQKIFFDGKEVSLSVYQIDGYNYFKLRDVAALCRGTDAKFNVKYNLDNGKISVTPGEEYAQQDANQRTDFGKTQETEIRNLNIAVLEQNRQVKTAFLDGHNYMRLRDLGRLLDLDILFSEHSHTLWMYSNALANRQLNLSNNRNYPWYMDQLNTGTYNISNCGPTATAMAMKWSNSKSKVTGESLRGEIVKGGGWWDTEDVRHTLEKYHIPYDRLLFHGSQTLISLLDRGDVALLCLDNSYIQKGSRDASSPYGRYYDTVGGHFLIVKGYKRTNGKLYFEVYDPNNNGRFYPKNNEPMGKDRYYEARDIEQAVRQHWAYVYEIMEMTQK